jgi:heme exporter protein D
MPQDVAASLRNLPSSTNAKASIRRAAANIVATLGHRRQVLRRVLHPRDRNRHHASLLADQKG